MVKNVHPLPLVVTTVRDAPHPRLVFPSVGMPGTSMFQRVSVGGCFFLSMQLTQFDTVPAQYPGWRVKAVNLHNLIVIAVAAAANSAAATLALDLAVVSR